MKYKVEFEYNVPEWATVELEAPDEETARLNAFEQFDLLYPEAVDVLLIEVKTVD